MELWTFINKKNGDIIRFNKEETGCSEFGTIYYLSDFEFFPVWFSLNEEDINFLLSKEYIHPRFSQFYETPDISKINLNEYEIKKVTI